VLSIKLTSKITTLAGVKPMRIICAVKLAFGPVWRNRFFSAITIPGLAQPGEFFVYSTGKLFFEEFEELFFVFGSSL